MEKKKAKLWQCLEKEQHKTREVKTLTILCGCVFLFVVVVCPSEPPYKTANTPAARCGQSRLITNRWPIKVVLCFVRPFRFRFRQASQLCD